jgi:hypothetical protein
MKQIQHNTFPAPTREADTGTLPSALTFFVTRAQRDAILRLLECLSDDRSRALLIALGEIEPGEGVCS